MRQRREPARWEVLFPRWYFLAAAVGVLIWLVVLKLLVILGTWLLPPLARWLLS